jgi:hypothetical protein
MLPEFFRTDLILLWTSYVCFQVPLLHERAALLLQDLSKMKIRTDLATRTRQCCSISRSAASAARLASVAAAGPPSLRPCVHEEEHRVQRSGSPSHALAGMQRTPPHPS